jgi:hypothetical protein
MLLNIVDQLQRRLDGRPTAIVEQSPSAPQAEPVPAAQAVLAPNPTLRQHHLPQIEVAHQDSHAAVAAVELDAGESPSDTVASGGADKPTPPDWRSPTYTSCRFRSTAYHPIDDQV